MPSLGIKALARSFDPRSKSTLSMIMLKEKASKTPGVTLTIKP
jgi:hypothetical protein